MDPAHQLLADTYAPAENARVALIEGGEGELASTLARAVPGGSVATFTSDWRELAAARAWLKSFDNAQAVDTVAPEAEAAFDAVLLAVPKGRRYARMLLASAWRALREGGELLVAGPSRQGAKSVIRDAEALFGSAELLGYKRHQRVARSIRTAERGETDWADQPGIAPDTFRDVPVTTPAGELTLKTTPGVFSWTELDPATAMLLENAHFEPGQRVWDVGCGAGAIGLAAAKAGADHVAMSDVNLLALRCAAASAEANHLAERTGIFPAAGVDASRGRWDVIASNPTFHRGHRVETDMAEALAEQAAAALNPGGRLVVVANRFLPYDKTMERHFAQVRTLAETNKFHVLEAAEAKK